MNSKRVSDTYAAFELKQDPSISRLYWKDLCHLLPLSNIFRSLPIAEYIGAEEHEDNAPFLALFSMAPLLGSLA
jgi:hypothetical protein